MPTTTPAATTPAPAPRPVPPPVASSSPGAGTPTRRPHAPGRPSRAARRTQVLELATELFAEHGFHHISMDDIAERVGVSKPVLYRHFPGKLELYLEVVDRCADALIARVAAALEPTREPRAAEVAGIDVVRAVIDAYAAFVREAGATASLLFESDVTRDEAVRERVLRPDAVNAQAFADVAGRLGRLAPDRALVLGRTCTAVARTGAVELAGRADDGTDVAHDEIADLLASFAWNGLQGCLVTVTPPGSADSDTGRPGRPGVGDAA